MLDSWHSHRNALFLWEALDQKSLHVDQIHTNSTYYLPTWVSLVAQLVKSLPAMQETWVRFLGWEDTLERGMATHSSILALENPMDRGAWHGVIRVRHDLATTPLPPPTSLISPRSLPYHMELRPVPQGLFSRVQKSHFLCLNLISELSRWTSISHPCLHIGITGGTLRIQMPGIPELLR